MTQEYRIAHISDLHLSPDYFPERTERFRMVLLQCRQLNVDHIIITGDVTNQARREELEHFRSVLKEFSLLDGNKISVVIGNHDIFGGPYHAEDVLKFPSLCKSTNYDAKVDEFYNGIKETFEGARFFSPKSAFPFVKVLGDVAVIGINSIARWHALKNPIGSNGKVDEEQREMLKKIFDSTPVKKKHLFVAIHHHFNKKEDEQERTKFERLWLAFESATLKLHKKKRLLKLFRHGGVQHVLHGHVHQHEEYHHKGVRFLNAGGSIIPVSESKQAFHLFIVQGAHVTVKTILLQRRAEKNAGMRKNKTTLHSLPIKKQAVVMT
ncbi:MAG: metallophosphoesterase [Bacteroidota bacterium]